MLKKISLENFKSFKKLENFELKPLTLLCGTNSSGKSTILKLLLLFEQSFQAFDRGFLWNGQYVKMGSLLNL